MRWNIYNKKQKKKKTIYIYIEIHLKLIQKKYYMYL